MLALMFGQFLPTKDRTIFLNWQHLIKAMSNVYAFYFRIVWPLDWWFWYARTTHAYCYTIIRLRVPSWIRWFHSAFIVSVCRCENLNDSDWLIQAWNEVALDSCLPLFTYKFLYSLKFDLTCLLTCIDFFCFELRFHLLSFFASARFDAFLQTCAETKPVTEKQNRPLMGHRRPMNHPCTLPPPPPPNSTARGTGTGTGVVRRKSSAGTNGHRAATVGLSSRKSWHSSKWVTVTCFIFSTYQLRFNWNVFAVPVRMTAWSIRNRTQLEECLAEHNASNHQLIHVKRREAQEQEVKIRAYVVMIAEMIAWKW